MPVRNLLICSTESRPASFYMTLSICTFDYRSKQPRISLSYCLSCYWTGEKDFRCTGVCLPLWFLLPLVICFDVYKSEYLKQNQWNSDYLIWIKEKLANFHMSYILKILFIKMYMYTCTHTWAHIHTHAHVCMYTTLAHILTHIKYLSPD